MLSYLQRSGSDASKLIPQLLTERQAVARLIRALVGPQIKTAKDRERAAKVALALTSACEKQLTNEADASQNIVTSAILGLLRLDYFLSGSGSAGEPVSRVDAALAKAAQAAAVTIMRKVEENPADASAPSLMALRGDELHRLVHDHLQLLASAVRAPETPVERGTAYQLSMAKKDVLRQLADIMDKCTNANELTEELEDMLFNHGVRTIGKLGETVTFDPRLHEIDSGAASPGEAVRVTRVGRQIGDEPNVIVISKMRIRTVNN